MKRKPPVERPTTVSNPQTEVDDSYAWFQHLDWWGDLSPAEISDRLLRVTFEYDDGWAVVPLGFVRERFDDGRELGEAQDESVSAVTATPEMRAIARDILLDLVRTKGPSSEWPRVAWEMARKFAAIESER